MRWEISWNIARNYTWRDHLKLCKILYTRKYSPLFYFHPFHPHRHWTHLRLSKFYLLIYFNIAQSCLGDFKTGNNSLHVWKGKNNTLYSIFLQIKKYLSFNKSTECWLHPCITCVIPSVLGCGHWQRRDSRDGDPWWTDRS